MKESELKPLVKQVLREMFKKQLNEWISDEMENYEIVFEPLVIPGLSTETDTVTVVLSLSYDAEGDEVHLLDWDFMFVKITPEQGEEKIIDDFSSKSVTPEQFKLLKKAVNDYISANKDVIEGDISDKL